MELALLITTTGFVHIFEEIISLLDTKSLFVCPLVCKGWWQIIQNHPKWWSAVIRRIRIKKALIHPDFRGIMESVEAKRDIKNLGLVLREFCSDKEAWNSSKFEGIQGMNMRDSGFFKLVFGDLQRLEFFWQHLPNKNPMFIGDEYSALHILASLGHIETFQFIAEKVDDVNPCRSIPKERNEENGVTDHVTPLYIANQNNHFKIVQIIEDKLQNAANK